MAVKTKDYIQINNRKIALIKTSSCSLLELLPDKFKEECFEQKRKQMDDFIECSKRKSDFERLPERMTVSFLELAGTGRGLAPAAEIFHRTYVS